jgi:hypothetical protein
MASVFIGDLDDFLAPSQACVNPLYVDSKETKEDPAPQVRALRAYEIDCQKKQSFGQGDRCLGPLGGGGTHCVRCVCGARGPRFHVYWHGVFAFQGCG